MKILQFGVTMILAVGLIGCSGEIPKCGDEEATELVLKIVNQTLENQVGKELAAMFKFKLSAIRTTDKNDKVGSYNCAAQLTTNSISTNTSSEAPITYTIESTDDGKEFYINVFGL